MRSTSQNEDPIRVEKMINRRNGDAVMLALRAQDEKLDMMRLQVENALNRATMAEQKADQLQQSFSKVMGQVGNIGATG